MSLAIVLGAGLLYGDVRQLVSASNWVTHTVEVRAELRGLLASVLEIETAQRGYTISGNEVYLRQFEQAIAQATRSLATIKTLTSDNATQQERLTVVAHALARRTEWARQVVRARQVDGPEAALQLVASGRGLALTEAVRASIGAMEDEENRLLAIRSREQSDTIWATVAGFVLFAAISVLLAALVLYVMRRDLAHRQQAQQRLLVHAQALDASVNGVLITNATSPDELIQYVNPAVERMSGYAAQELVGKNCRIFQGNDREQPELEQVRLALREGRCCRVVLRNYRKDGTLFWNDITIAPVRAEAGRITHHVGILHDITERVQYEQELHHKVHFDALTGLPNRTLLIERLRGALTHAKATQTRVAVAVIDLDNFRYVNDSLGHEAGDRLLQEIARRLQWIVGPHNTLARVAADEFVVVTSGYANEEALATLADGLLSTAAHKIIVGGNDVLLTCSIGVSVFPGDATDAETLLKNADLAMHRAKAAGRNRFELFLPVLSQRVHERVLLERGMRAALEKEEFVLHFQPQVDLRTGTIIGAEALIRWMHPERGMIPPSRFIPVAEETGLILPLGEWILDAACTQCRRWHARGLDIRIAVNLSADQFRQKDFVSWVTGVLRSTGLPATALELELTESLLMTGADDVLGLLDRLKEEGVELAIDDFGTGYSSLSYLKRLPVDRLKIDQSFIRGLPHDADDAAITRSVISLARAMSLSVIAEGIENPAQKHFLDVHGCDEGQGYLFSRPLPAADFEALIFRA